jgi:hypothetical protein
MYSTPLPILGNILNLLKVVRRMDVYSKYPFVEMADDCFGKDVPKVSMFVIAVSPLI